MIVFAILNLVRRYLPAPRLWCRFGWHLWNDETASRCACCGRTA